MRTRKQRFFLFLKWTFALLILTILGLYFFRDTILESVMTSAKVKFEEKYHAAFTAENAKFMGVSGIQMEHIAIVPHQADTLLSVAKIKTNISLFQLLTGDIQIQNLEMQNGYIQLVKNENGRNFDAFLKKDKTEQSDTKKDYAKKAYRILNKLLNLFPSEMSLKNLSLKLDDMGEKVSFQMHELNLKEKQLDTQILVTTSTYTQNWKVNGFANPRDKKADLVLSTQDTTKIRVPYIQEKFGLKTEFSKIRLRLDNLEMNFGELHLDGLASVENFTLNHPKIARKDVVLKNAEMECHFLFGSDFIALDSSSVAKLNKIKIKPFLEYNTEQDTLYKMNLNIDKMSAQDFITSLPEGLFTHFTGMQAEGDFDYHLNFQFNKNKPDRLIFESKFNKNNLKITKYGEANLEKLNHDFIYRAIENGVPQRPISVSLDNPNFTPLDQISPYLQAAVLTSEDPSFMHHRGFITEAFKQSIVKNIRTKKFARGASTISMQLVKNVFLTREKTLSRKLEEILLVYILENNRIASKERMLEVYFNIIEWGPNVYGIGEAAEFYFQKRPIDLSLNECLYLASIVPKPKKFMWQFDAEGHQKSYASQHQKFIKNLMLRRALITSEDTIGQAFPINISGRARSFLKLKIPQDSIVKDSISLEEFGNF